MSESITGSRTARGTSRAATTAAWVAFALGLAYALVSAYWGLGGTALLGTLGGALEREARSGSLGSQVLVWGAAVLKLVGALLPVAVVTVLGWSAAPRAMRLFCWIEAVVLTVYGSRSPRSASPCRSASSPRPRRPTIARCGGTRSCGIPGSSSGACSSGSR